jgi:CDP-diacylglycerol--glycerol-3-phosphate 3-phosphatidyltransferase
LSSDYFSNRQDRYHLFSSPEVTNYFWNIHHGATSFSFLVEPSTEASGFKLAWPETNSAPSPLEDPSGFVKSTTKTVQSLLSRGNGSPVGEVKDTRVYMLGQMSQIMKPDHSTELPVLTHVLKTLSAPEYRGASWTFTAGYFNPESSLTKLLLNTACQGNNTVITASPQANGFYGSKGVSGMLPPAYTLLARQFLKTVNRQGRNEDITLKEWRKGTVGEPEGWTYHAKGLWVTMPGDANPSVSIIGSSNYTKRSYSLDLEVGALIVTKNDKLKQSLGQEQSWLQDHTKNMTLDDFAKNDRRVGLKVRIAMWIVQLVGGAL